MDEAFWDERYGSIDKLWSGNPNPQLVDQVSDLSPGTALDAGCGEGADAIWLAQRGWRVTAVDFSRVALERGAARALHVGAEVAERITWTHADLATWVPPVETFDLVSAHFMHFPREQREPLYRRLAASVAPAGTLLIVAHHPSRPRDYDQATPSRRNVLHRRRPGSGARARPGQVGHRHQRRAGSRGDRPRRPDRHDPRHRAAGSQEITIGSDRILRAGPGLLPECMRQKG